MITEEQSVKLRQLITNRLAAQYDYDSNACAETALAVSDSAWLLHEFIDSITKENDQ